ncbi:hypothetical protein GCM10010841_31580 [Deinococcus aerophilus]|uniref:Carboxyltransferase domain-containing protein n=1 Tax=Deinococcus aerophilus TaxID=522488 RepID=A0ABQ2H1H5_9DEIO|nr:hypothetical protein GCM10010841_31580 [Deinococcus aerophilus]
MQTTVQDAGRRARALGVAAGGAADPVALRLANALVGNPAGAAALEVTLVGPTLRFDQNALISVCGAPFVATLDGAPFGLWRAAAVRAGQTLALGSTPRGLRAVLAVRGGLRAQTVFGSASTDLRGGFGGHGGRALVAGDRLTWEPAPPLSPPGAFISPALHTPPGPHHVLRVSALPEATPELLRALTTPVFTVSSQADRMGLRVTEAVAAPHDPARVSLPNVPGMVQVPPDGRPIVLGPDAGTHGGYPTPLAVIRADLPRLGQLRPGDTLQFRAVDLSLAHAALREQERALRSVEAALGWRHAHA